MYCLQIITSVCKFNNRKISLKMLKLLEVAFETFRLK